MNAADPVARREAASLLGKRRWEVARQRGKRLALMHRLGLHGVTDAALLPYIDSAIEFSAAERDRLARIIGAGTLDFG